MAKLGSVLPHLLLEAEAGAYEAQPPLRRLYLDRESAFRTLELISYQSAGIGLGLRWHLTCSWWVALKPKRR